MRKTMDGYCPLFNSAKTITINYVDCSTIECKEYAKGTYSCDCTSLCTLANRCPVYKNAPNII